MIFFQKGIHGETAGLYQHRHLSLPGTLGYLGMNLKLRRWCLIYRWNDLNFFHRGIPFSPDVPTLWNLRLRERLQRKRLSSYYSHTRWSIAWLLVAPHMCSVRFLDGEARHGFFEHIKSLQPWHDHPVLCQPDVDFEMLIPLALHCDGAQFYRDDENFIWSFGSIFGSRGNVKDVLLMKFPLAIIPERFMQDVDESG